MARLLSYIANYMSQVITTGDLQSYLPSSVSWNATLAATIVNSVNQYVENETKRVWGLTKDITETYDWKKTLWLRQMDVTAIGSIKIGYPNQTLTTIDPTGYYFNSRGRVTLIWQSLTGAIQSPLHNDLLTVTYTYGVTDVPSDLKEAALGVATGLYNWAVAGGKEIVASSVGSYHIETINAVRGSSGDQKTPYNNAAEHHFEVIQSYKKLRV